MTVASECVVCSVSAAKYTCPACGRRTCSVECCQQHKRQYTCSGQRCQTVAATFVPLAEYKQQHLLDDYHHLERLSRDVEVIRRRRQQQQQLQGSSGTLTNAVSGNSGRSQRTGDTSGASTGGDKRGGLTRRDEFRLRRIVARRATGCRLLFLPPLFERHRINTTTTSYTSSSSSSSTALAAVGRTAAGGATAAGGGTCRVWWCVEWLLPCDQLRYVTDRVPDNVRLCSVLDQVLKELQRKVHAQHSSPGCQVGATKSGSSLAVPSVTDTDSHSYEHDPIAIYRAALETRSLCAFLRVEKSRDSQRYRQLSMSRTLCHALRHQCVIEFPTLLLVTSHNAHMLLPAPSNVVDARLKTGVDNSDVVSGAPCRSVSAVANSSGVNSDICGGRRQQQQLQLVPPPRLDSVAVVAAEFFSPAAGVAARPAAEAAAVAVRATGGHSWWPAHSVSARPTDAPSDAAAAAVAPVAVPTLSAAAATAALPVSVDDSEDVWSDAGDHEDDDDADDRRDHDLAADTDWPVTWSVSRPDTSVPDTAGPRHSTLSAETNFGLLGCADDSDCD